MDTPEWMHGLRPALKKKIGRSLRATSTQLRSYKLQEHFPNLNVIPDDLKRAIRCAISLQKEHAQAKRAGRRHIMYRRKRDGMAIMTAAGTGLDSLKSAIVFAGLVREAHHSSALVVSGRIADIYGRAAGRS